MFFLLLPMMKKIYHYYNYLTKMLFKNSSNVSEDGLNIEISNKTFAIILLASMVTITAVYIIMAFCLAFLFPLKSSNVSWIRGRSVVSIIKQVHPSELTMSQNTSISDLRTKIDTSLSNQMAWVPAFSLLSLSNDKDKDIQIGFGLTESVDFYRVISWRKSSPKRNDKIFILIHANRSLPVLTNRPRDMPSAHSKLITMVIRYYVIQTTNIFLVLSHTNVH